MTARRQDAGRKLGPVALAAALSYFASALTASALPTGETVVVTADQAKLVQLPAEAQTVVVGNPAIADVTLQRHGILVVTGKSYGTTNLIALDGAGKVLAESLVQVEAPTGSVVTVLRGLDRESYSCTPNCQPTIVLGDDKNFFGNLNTQAGQRNSLATGK